MKKTDIKKIIQDQPKNSIPKVGSQVPQKQSLSDNPLFAVAQGMVENLSTPYKLAIGGAIWLLVSGLAANIYTIYKLISLAF